MFRLITTWLVFLFFIGCGSSEQPGEYRTGDRSPSPAENLPKNRIHGSDVALKTRSRSSVEIDTEKTDICRSPGGKTSEQRIDTPGNFNADPRTATKVRVVADIELVGTWVVDRVLDGSALSIGRDESGKLVITFETGGCFGWRDVSCSGQYEGGVLTVDEHLEEYFPLKYKSLYTIRVDGEELLLPSSAVKNFEKGLSTEGKIMNPAVRKYVYQRGKEKGVRDSVRNRFPDE